jgi:hypothetical protein
MIFSTFPGSVTDGFREHLQTFVVYHSSRNPFHTPAGFYVHSSSSYRITEEQKASWRCAATNRQSKAPTQDRSTSVRRTLHVFAAPDCVPRRSTALRQIKAE